MKNNEQQSALIEAIGILGSQTLLAEAIGTKQQNISYWLKHGFINPDFVIPIEKATNFKVSRHRLSPGIYPLDGEKSEAA